MNHTPRETAAVESYPTFWSQPVAAPAAPAVTAQPAYEAFVSWCEEDFPAPAPRRGS